MTDDLRDRVARIEGEMKAMEARNEALKSDVRANLSDMKADMRADFSQLREDLAARDLELAKRDKDNNRWTIGLVVAAVVVLGIIIRWPVGTG